MTDNAPAGREVPPAIGAPPLSPVGERWAVLVGVSKYRAAGLDLRFAHRDAQDLHKLIVSPEGGNFDPDHIRLLCDKKATTAAVTRAVRGFLLGALPDDLILLFFACHGGPDPRRPSGPLYLYTHDTDPADVAGTAFAMDEIDRALSGLIQARRVVIIADTCHSGGIGGGPGGRGAATAEATHMYLDAMAAAKGGVALLTSAEAAESSLEDERWGGGHGVFTHYLLEGMRGHADGFGDEKDGIVSVGELFEYVRAQVRRDTDGRQNPAIGTTHFDRRLPMAVTGELDVVQHLSLGHRLVDVGWLLDDPAPMLLAAQQFALAADFKRNLPTADADRGAALLAAGHHDEAIAVLRTAIGAGPQVLEAAAWLNLGVALAETGRYDAAEPAFAEYLRREPDGEDAAWVAAYLEWLRVPAGRVHALLIGPGTFAPESGVSPLPGVANDVALMAAMLIDTFGVDPAEVDTCVDDAATVTQIRHRLAAMRGRAGPDDTVVVYFSGHSDNRATADEPFLIGYGGPDDIASMSPRDLAAALQMAVRDVVVVLDTHIARSFLDLLPMAPNLTVLMACGVDEVAYESYVDGVQHGLFTASLVSELTAGGRTTTYGALLDATQRRVQADPAHLGQTPQLFGVAQARVLTARFPLAGFWRAARRAVPRAADEIVLGDAADALDDPRAWWALGRRELHDDHPDRAVARLFNGRAPTTAGRIDLDLAIVAIDQGHRDEAITAIDAAIAHFDGEHRDRLARAAASLAPFAAPPPTIVVIAPMTHGDGPRQRVDRLAATLASTFDLRVDAVRVLTVDATVAATREQLRRCATSSGDQLHLLVYIGALHFEEGFAFRLADGSLPASEVRAIVGDGPNLVTMMQLESVRDREVGPQLTVPGVVELGVPLGVTVAMDELESLIGRLRDVWANHLTYHDWVAGIPTAMSWPEWASDVGVVDRARWMTARREILAVQRAAGDEVVRLAEGFAGRRRAQHEEYPVGHLQSGLGHAAAGRYADALRELRAARNIYDDPSLGDVERAHDVHAGRWHAEARYHCGRLEYEHGDDLYGAVATLQMAARQLPDDPRVLLHVTSAIKALVERESLVEARRYARRYLAMGAPLGEATPLRAFVDPAPPV